MGQATDTPAKRRDPNARSITFRLPLELYETIADYADDERRSLNAVTCLLLEEAIDARESEREAQEAELAQLRELAKQQRKAEREAKQAQQATA
ncbi:MAG: hypothetical protein ACO289_02125 [Prochlorococcaceae cyanobacterium]